MIIRTFFGILFLSLFSLHGQPVFPEKGEVFVDHIVPRVDIIIHPDTLDWLYHHENLESNIEFHAIFIFNNGNIIDTIEDIGFRLRGNTSRYSAKKSFKVSFNTYEKGRKWYGLEKLNLNGEHNDPSVIRAKICWDILYDFSIPAPRSNHVEVYINGNYYGLYINVEHIDEEFVESRFGNMNGNLFKCLYPADLDYLGSNQDAYKAEIYGRRPYDLKTNTAHDDYSDLAHFIDVLNNIPDDQFLCEIEKIFNIYDYLKIVAVDIFTGNWDGYIYNKNNFYLYRNTKTGKFEYIPYDLDNTLGIDWIGRDWATRDIYDWQQHGDQVRPLYTRIMNNQALKNQFTHYLDDLISSVIGDTYFEKIDEIRDMISPYIIDDPYYPMDYGYSYNDFLNSYEQALGGHVAYGLKPYMNQRIENAYAQMENNNMNPVIKYISRNSPSVGEDLWVNAFVDHPNLPDVKIIYSIDGGSLQNTWMYDDGNHHDGESNDRCYGGVIPDLQLNSMIEYRIMAEDPYGYQSTMPCEPLFYTLYNSSQPALFINEFLASNNSTNTDEYGEYDDWIELYNGGTEPVWLGDKYLTDNLGNPGKWLMPGVWLEPGEFVLFWADDDTDQGPYHTNFKLNADAEEIGLFDSEFTGFFPIDTISYIAQSPDISYGRNPDGGTAWVHFSEPTPGYSNVTGNLPVHRSNMFGVYPNPVQSGNKVHFTRPTDFILFNLNGEKLLERKQADHFSTRSLPSGFYILEATGETCIKIIIH